MMKLSVALLVLSLCLVGSKSEDVPDAPRNEDPNTDNLSLVANETGPNSESQNERADDACTDQKHPRNCKDVICRDPDAESGVYKIVVGSCMKSIKVYCDMDTEGGGWTVFQRRMDGSVNFYRGWNDYEKGFGSLRGEFWLGNENIHLLAEQCNQELRIDLADFEKEHRVAKYSTFRYGPLGENYKLTVSGYSGTANDSFSSHSGMMFSTKDRQNDLQTSGNGCAQDFKGAWWYSKCHNSNLNGQYLKGSHTTYANGVNWHRWRGYHYSLKFTEMKIRPK